MKNRRQTFSLLFPRRTVLNLVWLLQWTIQQTGNAQIISNHNPVCSTCSWKCISNKFGDTFSGTWRTNGVVIWNDLSIPGWRRVHCSSHTRFKTVLRGNNKEKFCRRFFMDFIFEKSIFKGTYDTARMSGTHQTCCRYILRNMKNKLGRDLK